MSPIARISITTAGADELAGFYEAALGFERIRVGMSGKAFARRSVGESKARTIMLGLGRQEVELAGFPRPSRPYPVDRASNDPWFQHMAIVVSDMQAAHARLSATRGWSAITTPEPQRLPASSGGVVAFKFRDPEGHPLELLEFPPGNAPPAWRQGNSASSFLGIDHSAIVVSDTERSVEFYKLLGFAVSKRSLNQGIEQAHLDGLADPVVEVTALDLAAASQPHLELLRYRSPPSAHPIKFDSHDVAATRLVLRCGNLATLGPRLSAAGIGCIVLGGTARDVPVVAVCDPDGHELRLMD